MNLKKRFFILMTLLCLISVVLPLNAQEATEEAESDVLVSPIPGAECDTETEPSGDPIRVGGSLALTGPFAPTANIHRVVGELYVDWVNECGGLLGRPLEWVLLDDQSSTEQTAANYERLISVDNVDLLIGPYAAAAILAGAGPAQRANMIYVTHTNGAPQIDLGDYHFPTWQIGNGDPENPPWIVSAETLWDAVESSGNTPANAFYVTNKFPTTMALTAGAREVGEERDIETLDFIEYEPGTTDFSAIALRISAQDPDMIVVGGIALDGVNLYDAFDSIGYTPKGIFIALPSPGPTMALGETVEGLMSLSIFEENEPFTDDPVAAEFIERYQEAAEEERLLNIVETQAAASFSAWQTITAAVTATESLDNEELQSWLKEAEFDVIAGTISFEGFNGYGTDFNRIMQIQDGKRVIVFPLELAPEDVTVQYPNE